MLNKNEDIEKGFELLKKTILDKLPHGKRALLIMQYNYDKEDLVIEDEFISLIDSVALTLTAKNSLRSVTIPFNDIKDIKKRGRNSFEIRPNDKRIRRVILKLL